MVNQAKAQNEAHAADTADSTVSKFLDAVWMERGLSANTLAAYGERLSAGDVIITGSITPPIMIEADEEEMAHVLDPIGEVSVRFSRD